MTNREKDGYFQFKDKLIKSLPEPERSVYTFFRQTEERNLKESGRLIVNGKSPVELTAEHFKLSRKETNDICLSASLKLKDMARND